MSLAKESASRFQNVTNWYENVRKFREITPLRYNGHIGDVKVIDDNGWNEIISKIPVVSIKRIISKLENSGIVTDEDHMSLSRIMMKYASGRIIELLKKCGCHLDLRTHAKYFSQHGEIAVIYDANRFEDYQEVDEYLRQVYVHA